MSFLERIKKLLGIGGVLLLVSIAFEIITAVMSNYIGIHFILTFGLKISLTVALISILLAGMIWFNWTLNLIKINIMGEQRELVISGPFSYVRHPLYAILIFTLPPLAVVWYSDLLFLLPWALVIASSFLLVRFEEQNLLLDFGDSYRRYQKHVPALFPYKGRVGKRYYYEIINGEDE